MGASETASIPTPTADTRLLVVDDESNVASVIARMLRRAGYRLSVANSGRSGLCAALGQWYDVVLLDLALPDISGMDVLKALSPPRKCGDVIIVTGCTVAFKEETAKLGACDYVQKPAMPELLLDAVSRTLGRQRLQQECMCRATAYIDRHYAAIRSIREVAKALGVTTRAIEYEIKRDREMPALMYLHCRRVQEAKCRLETTDEQMKDIAAATGFTTPQHFGRIFRTLAGVSPTERRLRCRHRDR